MKQLFSILLIVAVVLVVGAMALAQQPTKIARLGFLATPSHSSISDRYDAFVHGLRELGYMQGKDISIERQTADGKVERLPELAAELVRFKSSRVVRAQPVLPRTRRIRFRL
jgi:putative tryptophan/tyrosine transport system substrate-binding protein